MDGVIAILKDLRRRKVFRGTGFYLLGAWSLVQVADVLADPLGLPPWTIDALLFVAVIGFPIAIWIAWRYELTDRGLVRTRPAAAEDVGPLRLGAIDYLVLAALLSVTGFVAWQGLESIRLTSDAEQAPTVAAEVPDAPASSIAVLPFDDLSQNSDHAYLAEGLSDTVLQMLSRVEGLSVTSRTSSFAFRNRDLTATQIASALGVANLLEGSVQRSGDQLRVIARLVEARSSRELWSRRFDSDLADLFAIQDEIAQAVAAALKTSVVDADSDVVVRYEPTLEAYEQYVLARRALYERSSESVTEAVERMERAVELDPEYALAKVGLARALLLRSGQRRQPPQEIRERVETLIDAALDQDPTLAEAWLARAGLRGTDKDFEAAYASLERVLELDPNLADAHAQRSQLLSLEGRGDDALAAAQRAVELDPQSDSHRRWLSVVQWDLARAEAALATLRENIERHPGAPDNYMLLARRLNQLGRPGEATLYVEALHRQDPDNLYLWKNFCDQLFQLWAMERHASCLRDYLATNPDDLDALKWLREAEGNMDAAIAIAQREVEANPTGWYTRMQLADRLLRGGRVEDVEDVLLKQWPELASDDPPLTDFTQWAGRMLAQAWVAQGQEERAEPLLDAVMAHIERSRKLKAGGLVAGVEDAMVHALRGEDDAAIEVLDRAVASDWTWFARSMVIDPAFDSLRDDPRFQAVVERLEQHLADEREEYETRRESFRIQTLGS